MYVQPKKQAYRMHYLQNLWSQVNLESKQNKLYNIFFSDKFLSKTKKLYPFPNVVQGLWFRVVGLKKKPYHHSSIGFNDIKYNEVKG